MATRHTHPTVFGRLVPNCPRCTELKAGAPKVQWRNQRAAPDRTREVRAHNCKAAGCGPICTFGDW